MDINCEFLNKFVDEFLEELKFGAISTNLESSATIFEYTNGKTDLTAIHVGKEGTVPLPDPPYNSKGLASIHTHTSGDLEFSPMDYVIAMNNGHQGHCVVLPSGERHCELLDPSKLSEKESNEWVKLFLECASPRETNRDTKYRRIGDILKKTAVSCDQKQWKRDAQADAVKSGNLGEYLALENFQSAL